MAGEVADPFATGQEALALGDWATARDSFRAALEREETAEGQAGLADALWWLEEIGVAATVRAPGDAAVAGSMLRARPLSLHGKAPNGQWFKAIPKVIWAVADGRALVHGADLGASGRSARRPRSAIS